MQEIVALPLLKNLLSYLPAPNFGHCAHLNYSLWSKHSTAVYIHEFTKVKKKPNHSPIFSSLRLTLECCHPQVHSLLHSLPQLLQISEALHCKRQIIPLRNLAKPVLFAVPGSQMPPAPLPRLKGPWLMCTNEVNLLATR